MEDPKAIVRRGYDRVSRAYRADDADDGQYAPWLELLEQRLVPGSAVLDLGCGCGVPVARRLARRYVVTGVDLSPVQIERARGWVQGATFICADNGGRGVPGRDLRRHRLSVRDHPRAALGAAGDPAFGRELAPARRIFIATVGHGAWTGIEKDWLGVDGGDMWWSHADTSTYLRWLSDAGLIAERETFVHEGKGGHTLVVAIR